jgi:endonuclease YncB( thermonuclease family)
MYRLLAYALVLLSLGLAQGVLVGRASVVDGDTLEIQGVRVRLWGIDAVESSQACLDAGGKPWPCGRRAAFALADFLGGAHGALRAAGHRPLRARVGGVLCGWG